MTLNQQISYLLEQSPILQVTYPTNRTTQMWNYTVNWAKHILDPYDEVDCMEHPNNSIWFNVNDLIYLRFKKLDKHLKPSNIMTKRMEAVYAQAQIEGFPPNPTIVDVGYCVDSTWTNLKNIYFVCWSNGQKLWEIDLLKETGTQLHLFANNETAKENLASLVRIKEHSKLRKTNGDSIR